MKTLDSICEASPVKDEILRQAQAAGYSSDDLYKMSLIKFYGFCEFISDELPFASQAQEEFTTRILYALGELDGLHDDQHIIAPIKRAVAGIVEDYEDEQLDSEGFEHDMAMMAAPWNTKASECHNFARMQAVAGWHKPYTMRV